MKHPHAVSLAKRLIDTRLKRNSFPYPHDNGVLIISEEQIAWASEILATHLDACMCQRVHPDLSEAVEDAIEFALRNERAYEPIPQGARWHSALVVLEEQDAD